MKKMLQIFISTIYIILIVSPAFAGEEQDRFLEAKKKCISQEWYEAITLFEEFLDDFPESRNNDDARFWIAYSLEKIPGEQSEAFIAYSNLTSSQPESPWTDDAIMHQINLAEMFIREGKDQYREFLYEKLESDIDEVKYQNVRCCAN